MYQLEDVKNETAASNVFSKFFKSAIDKRANNFFLSVDTAPDFCKLIGFSLSQGAHAPEEVTNLMRLPGFEKDVKDFNLRHDKLHDKLVSAKKAAKSSYDNVGGLKNIGNVADLITIAEQQGKQEQANTKVIKAKGKLDNYLEKNKTMSEAAIHIGKTESGVVWNTGDEDGTSVFDTISAINAPPTGELEIALETLKRFIDELLAVSSKVSVMLITDGNKTPTSTIKRNVKLQGLTAAQLMNAKNREAIVITK